MSGRTVDARGLKCPWPVLRLARAMADGTVSPVTILADDPAAPGEIAALAVARGWKVVQDGDRFVVTDVGGATAATPRSPAGRRSG